MPRLEMKAAIVGIAGIALDYAEAALFRAHPPAGVILFARNIENPGQLRTLTTALRAVLPPHAVLMIDQEGGRVARMKPPHWPAHPPAATIGKSFEKYPAAGLRAAWLTGALIGHECAEAGFDVVCAPVLDLLLPETNAAIGDRAYSETPATVAGLGRAMAAGLLNAGIQPVGKHAPGHGRARVDSHLTMPVVDATDADLLPFQRNTDLPWLMTAHIRYPAWDSVHPATLSAAIIQKIIREKIGFHGLLVSDDLAMHALTGTPAERAQRTLAAGSDLALYCPGDPEGTAAVLAAVPLVTPEATARLAAARALAQHCRLALDPPALRNERDGLLG